MEKLSVESQDLLKKCIDKHNPSLSWTLQKERENELTVEEYNDLREIVCDELISNGFNEDGSINKYGIVLEALIDEIGSLFM